jgi:phosphatidate cytidylyltransferase
MRRILTALVLIPLVLALVLLGPSYLLVAVQFLLTLGALWEFFRLAESAAGVQPLRYPGYLFAAALAPVSLLGSVPQGIVAVTALFLMVLLVAGMLSRRALADYLKAVSATFLGVLYVALPLCVLVWVCLQRDGPFWTIFTLIVVWVGDSAAFLVGSYCGKHKLFPRISPNKTWEGTAASFGAALWVGLLYALFFSQGGRGQGELVVLAALLNVAAQLGDLAESALKRSAGVKDSSQLLPGHGGILDRIDALLFAAPVLWYYWLWKAS